MWIQEQAAWIEFGAHLAEIVEVRIQRTQFGGGLVMRSCPVRATSDAVEQLGCRRIVVGVRNVAICRKGNEDTVALVVGGPPRRVRTNEAHLARHVHAKISCTQQRKRAG